MALDVRIKRAYDPPEPGDGRRVLIDHVWPRGVRRDTLALDQWSRDLAPSDELRRWFGHDPARFEEFRARYRAELAAHSDVVADLRREARERPVTIVYAARDREHNNAVVLAELLREDFELGNAADTGDASRRTRARRVARGQPDLGPGVPGRPRR